MGNPVTAAFPGRLLAMGVHLGFRWEVAANNLGYRCGYVAVTSGHPWFGQDYDDVEPRPRVHGGLTYARPGTVPGEWWLGFDCAHAGDAPDPELPGYPSWLQVEGQDYGVLRTTGYVVDECLALIRQAAVAPPGLPLRVRSLGPDELR